MDAVVFDNFRINTNKIFTNNKPGPGLNSVRAALHFAIVTVLKNQTLLL